MIGFPSNAGRAVPTLVLLCFPDLPSATQSCSETHTGRLAALPPASHAFKARQSTSCSEHAGGRMQSVPGIVTFSHLRWDFVYQRPQHLLSRLASSRRVIFIEEPEFAEINSPDWIFSEPEPNVLVCRP